MTGAYIIAIKGLEIIINHKTKQILNGSTR